MHSSVILRRPIASFSVIVYYFAIIWVSTGRRVAIADLEQLNLTRNDLTHSIDIMSFNVKRDEKHAERFPIGLFTDDLWKGLDIERIRVDRAKLELAIRLVRDFCTWLDGIRCRFPQYVRAIKAGEPWPPIER